MWIRFQSTAISGWVFLVTSAQLSLVLPNVHWYLTAMLTVVLGLSFRPVRWEALRFPLLASFLLVVAICTVALASTDPAHDLIEAGKLAVILLLVLPLLASDSRVAAAAMRGAEIAVFVNAGLAVSATLGFMPLLGVSTPGRFGTILNWPGSLWRVGMLTIACSGLRFFAGVSGFRDLLLFVASALLIILDGSRTAYLIILAGTFALAGAIFRTPSFRIRRKGSSTVLRRTLVAAMLVAGFIVAKSIVSSDRSGSFERGSNMLQTFIQGGDSLKDLDDTRSEMPAAAWSAILDHPVLGTGMGTTRSSSEAGPMVVHIAYLQLWADVGMLAFLSFSALVIGSIPALWIRYKPIAMVDAKQAALFYNGIFLLGCWALAALFHPVATQLDPWIMFVLAYSCVVGSADAGVPAASVIVPSAPFPLRTGIAPSAAFPRT